MAKEMLFTETEIAEQIDLAFKGIPSNYYPKGSVGDIKYNFFLDLEDAYCMVAGSRIHLYADSTRWAIVFERNGYHTRASEAIIQFEYIGNCIDYPIEKAQVNYISNSSRVSLIDPVELQRIEYNEGEDIETFEKIGKDIQEIQVKGKMIPFDNNYKNYEKLGIKISDNDNPQHFIRFGDFIRYLQETNPKLIAATEEEIKQHLPTDLPKLMTIEEFHFMSNYDEKTILPGQQQTYKLIAKVLVTRDTTHWKPTLEPNNS